MNTALIVLDFVNGITHHDDIKNFIDKHHTMDHANKLINFARDKNYKIIFVKVGFSDSYVELAERSPLFKHNKPNNWLKLSETSTDFDPRLNYQANDIVVVKHRVSAFYATTLEAILNANQIEHIIVCGVSTNLAVEGTARDAHDRNYYVTIASDACATFNDELQHQALAPLKLITEVKTVEQICTE